MQQVQPQVWPMKGDKLVGLRWALAIGFTTIGISHFTHPEPFMAIMPAWIPFHRFCVLLSGAAEIAGGLGLLIPRLRRAAGWGLLLLLAAVFPANIHMAVHNIQIPGSPPLPEWALWLRLPFQPLMAWAVWLVALDQHRRSKYPTLANDLA